SNDFLSSNRIQNGGAAAVFTSKFGFDHNGTLQSATSTTAVLDSGASTLDGAYTGKTITITGGTGSGQSRTIISYVGATKTITVSGWTVIPDSISAFTITGSGTISDATDPGNNLPHIPGITDLATNVSFAGIPGFSANSPITHLTVTVNLNHATMAQVEIDLVSPTGQSIPLLLNQVGPDGKNIVPAQGVTG